MGYLQQAFCPMQRFVVARGKDKHRALRARDRKGSGNMACMLPVGGLWMWANSSRAKNAIGSRLRTSGKVSAHDPSGATMVGCTTHPGKEKASSASASIRHRRAGHWSSCCCGFAGVMRGAEPARGAREVSFCQSMEIVISVLFG